MSGPQRAGWPPLQITFWVLVTLAVLVVRGGPFVRSFRPEAYLVVDFSQEWLSAKNYWAGMPVYSDMTETIRLHMGLTLQGGESIVRFNAHPPFSILLTLPLGKLSYQDAMMVWNLVTFALFLVAIALVIRELRIPVSALSLLPATAIIVGCYPVFFQLVEGQLDCLLAFLLTVGWVADRRDRPILAGIALGTAGAIKLVPLFLFVYLVAARRWRSVIAMAATLVVLNGAAAAVLGIDAFRFYITEAVPAVAERFQSSPRNSSISGFWLRLFNPHPEVRIVPVAHQPLVAEIVANALRLVATGLAAWVAWRADTAETRDKAFATATVAMLLVAPLVWPHYFLLLVLPMALVWLRTPGLLLRIGMWIVFLVLLLPDTVVAMPGLGVQGGKLLGTHEQAWIETTVGLYSISLQHYALVVLFLLTLFAPRGSASADPTEAETDEARRDRRLFGPVGGAAEGTQR